uniref:Uncharacterized protein n=1 Tax=Acrobeloides nanus TaxID=290746 RepID=A0A914C131_9BILA
MEENMNILANENDSSLKTCVIEAFVMVCNIPIGEEQWNIEEIFKRLASIRSLIGRPLFVKNFFFKSRDDNITHYVLSHLENLFGELLHVETAHLGFYQHILRDIMDNPSLIELPSLPYIVNIRCGYCYSEESYYKADMVISFLTKMKFFDREYTFKLCYAEDEFKQKFERNFKKEMLPRLPKKFHLNVWPNGGEDEITIEIK